MDRDRPSAERSFRRKNRNEISENFAELFSEIRPVIFGVFLAGRKGLPPIFPQIFHIRDLKFQIKFHQKKSQRTSAGMTTR